jgi:hypothetical protein
LSRCAQQRPAHAAASGGRAAPFGAQNEMN